MIYMVTAFIQLTFNSDNPYICMLQSEGTLKFVWFTMKTVKPAIPSYSVWNEAFQATC